MPRSSSSSLQLVTFWLKRVIASEAKQSMLPRILYDGLLRFARNDEHRSLILIRRARNPEPRSVRCPRSFAVPAAGPQTLLHVLRSRRDHAHRLLVAGDRDSDLAGMQVQGRFAEARAVAVDIVTDDRPARGRRMHPKLMGAAGDRLHRKPSEVLREDLATSQHFPVGDG